MEWCQWLGGLGAGTGEEKAGGMGEESRDGNKNITGEGKRNLHPWHFSFGLCCFEIAMAHLSVCTSTKNGKENLPALLKPAQPLDFEGRGMCLAAPPQLPLP